MDQEEIKQLLPLYVAGILGTGERRSVEDALKDSAEMQEELRFWKYAQTALAAEKAFAWAGHPSTEDLEAYASWTLQHSAQRKTIDEHLHTCEPCSTAFRLLKEMEHVPSPVEPSLLERVQMAIKSLKLVVAVPVMAMMLVAGFFVYKALQVSPTLQDLNIVLTYERTTRSAPASIPPLLTIGEQTGTIAIRVAIPHNPSLTSRYSVAITSAGTKRQLITSAAPFHRGVPYDSLLVTLDRSHLEPGRHRYTLLVQEQNAPDAQFRFELPFDADVNQPRN